MNAEWEQFLEAAPWFRKRDQTVENVDDLLRGFVERSRDQFSTP